MSMTRHAYFVAITPEPTVPQAMILVVSGGLPSNSLNTPKL